MHTSDSDSDSEWNREMFIAVSKRQGKGRRISEQDRCKQIQDCIDQGANIAAVDQNGNTVLDIAVLKGYQEVITFLRQSGAQTSGVGSHLESGAERLASNLDKLDIANVSSNSMKQQTKETTRGPTATIIANDQPSTSGISIPSGQYSVPSQDTWHPKHKLITDAEHNVVAKKPRLMSDNTPEREGHRVDIGNTCMRSCNSNENLNDEENEERIVRRVNFDPNETYAASGLKQTLHGIVYQWKHLMLVLNRAWRKGYSFRLSTEMDAAEKFDDLVLEYVDSRGNKTHRFVQLKHKKDNTKVITTRDLLDVKDGEFSLLKYFVSWRKIKASSDFDGSCSKTFTLCTNIGLDLEGLRDSNIDVNVVKESDDFLEVTNRIEQPPRYKLQISKRSELYHTLQLASDVHRLAIEFAERVCGSKDIYLNTDIMKRYHAALAQEVVDVKNQKFSTNFIRNDKLSARAKNFRGIFIFHAKKLFKRNTTETDIMKILMETKLKISTSFGTKFELSANPDLTHIGRFADEFIKLVNNVSQDKVVKIDRRIYSKRASELSVERIFADNVDKLAGHVLIKEDKKIKFSSKFLNNVTQFLGNIEEFRDALKTRLGSKFDELDKFEFEINNFKTCTEDELSSSSVIELPDDDISDGEIRDFLNGFVLAVDQPDEKELGEMIKQEIGDSRFDMPDAKFVTDSFQIEILDWFKETGQQSVFLANENAKNIFNEIEGRLSSLVTMDLRSEYPEKLEKLDIRFERENIELWKFIRSSRALSNQIYVISSRQTLLTALRVHQTLKPLQGVGSHDGLIFVRLKRLFETNIIDQVLRTFEWRDNHNLLVIDCESICGQRYTQELWNPACRIMRKNCEKRMIIIIQDKQDLSVQFPIEYNRVHESDDNFGIVNLRKFSQQKLLERKVVKFQGHEESFGRLLGIRDFDNIEGEKLEHLKQAITSNILVQLVEGTEIRIGREVDGLGPIRNYYIPRRIVRHVIINEAIIKTPGISDLFAISGVNENALRTLLGDEVRIRSFDEGTQRALPLNECIILSKGEEASQFEKLCQWNSGRDIHWLQCMAERFTWIRTFGEIHNLLKYKNASGSIGNDKNGHHEAHSNEDELADLDPQHRIVILCDTAGMGKSTVLTSLAGKVKDYAFRKIEINEPALLIIKINLTQRTTVLAEERANRTFDCNNIDGAVNFLVDKLSSIDKSNDLDSRIYKMMITGNGQATLFFDGFDEISPTYEHIVLDLLKALVKLPMKKLFITTRPHTSEKLQEILGTFAHRLKPFSPNDQRSFLQNFWRAGFNENDCNDALEERLKVHTDQVMNLLTRAIDHDVTEFTGVPLQMRMVAEIYPCNVTAKGEPCDVTEATKNSKHNLELKLPEKIDIIDLYRQFVDRKYNVFFTEKQPGDPTNLAAKQSCEYGRLISTMKHQKFALDALFNEAASALLSSQPGVMDLIQRCREKNDGIERTGIVTLDADGKPQFIHRTFAEYFAAEFLIETLKEDSRNKDLRTFFVAQLFVESQYKTIRAFINCLLSRESTNAIANKSWKLDLRENRNDANRQTVYHVAAEELNVEIAKFVLNRLGGLGNDDSEDREASIDLQDQFGRTPVAVAVEKCSSSLVECFVNGGANICWKNFRNETLLHIAVKRLNNLAVVRYLCDNGVDIHHQDEYGNSPLYYAFNYHLDSDVMKYLSNKVDNINCQDEHGRSPLHHAIIDPQSSDIVKHLCDKGANTDCQDEHDMSPLHYAIIFQRDSAFKYLCDIGANVNCQDKRRQSPLHYAIIRHRDLEIVKYLCEKGADVNCKDEHSNSPLHYAIANEHAWYLGIVKYLCEKGASINDQDKDGKSPLHCAISNHQDLDTVKYLCDKGADVNCQDKQGMSPLHYATANDDVWTFDIAKYLCDKGADINCQDEDGRSPLHYAVSEPLNSNIVKYLCEKGANVNCQDSLGMSLLHHVIANDEAVVLDEVKYLCDKGASVHCRDDDGRSPLHYAISYYRDLDVVKYLYSRGADINCLDEYSRSPLHYAASDPQTLNILKYLCDEGANINCQDEVGMSPLHYAIANEDAFEFDAVKYLCDKGATINCQDKHGKSSLHYAITCHRDLNVVTYLCDRGADINCQDEDSKSPLQYAISEPGSSDIVEYLCNKVKNVT